MKKEMILMDPAALEIVLRCAHCHEPVTVKAADWRDDDIDG